MIKRKSILYGFEDYRLYTLSSDLLSATTVSNYSFYLYSYNNLIYPLKEEQVLPKGIVNLEELQDHPEIIQTAKSLYTHPDCKIPKSFLSQKYKKSLNPWMADGVVIPHCERTIYAYPSAIFINSDAKEAFVFSISDAEVMQRMQSLQIGVLFKNIVKYGYMENLLSSKYVSIVSLFNAGLEFVGSVLECTLHETYIVDVLSGSLPKSKLVFEDTVQKSLGNNENKPTLDNLISIYEMMSSSDNEVVGSAIKALSAMDYASYPNSVITVLKNATNWEWNKACDSTAAKYMFKYLNNTTARGYFQYRDRYISKEDYDLTLALLRHFNSGVSSVEYLRILPFTYEDETFNIHPRLKP